MRSKNILIVDDFSDSIKLYPLLNFYQDFDEPLELVLWQRTGLFRLIPESVINNAIDNYNDSEKLDERQARQVRIRWEQGIDVDPKIARILLGEQGD
jgi:hypothetical protein